MTTLSSERTEGDSRSSAWGAAILLSGLVVVLYGSILRAMVEQWADDPNYSHGFLVPVFSGYLLWSERERLREILVDPAWTGAPILVAGLGILLLGVVGAENFLMRSSLLIVIAGLLVFHCGWAMLRAVAFPLGFLLFMIPLPTIVFNAIAFPLQGVAASNATWTLFHLGVPVLQDGNVIHLPHITLGVTEACSGIRSLISLLALAVVWAHLAIPGGIAKVVLVAAAVPITIVANAGRIVLTGVIGQSLGIEYAQGFFHGFSGWIIFVVAALCLAGVHLILEGMRRLTGGAARR